MEKINFSELIDNPNWKEAVIVFSESNWLDREGKSRFPNESDRSYKIVNGQWGLDSSKMGRCIVGNCLDGKDLGVRLDQYDWEKEYCYIVK